MASLLKELMGNAPHSLDDIREGLNVEAANQKDFIPLMERHHDFLEESIDVLVDKDAPDTEKQAHLFRFFRLLEMHGKSEEETLYVALRANSEKEARLEGFGGQDEHDLAFQTENELLEMGYQSIWTEEIAAKAKVLATMVKNHILEEESLMFKIAQRDLSPQQLDDLKIDYLEKCREYFEESKTTSIANPVHRIRPDSWAISERRSR